MQIINIFSNPITITRKSGFFSRKHRDHTTRTPSDTRNNDITFSSNPIRLKRSPFLSSTPAPSAASVPLSQRQPNLLKCVVAYPDFWSTFIPQCMRLFVTMVPNVKDCFDLSTFRVPTIKDTITKFKCDYSLPQYPELTRSSDKFKERFCTNTSKWTTLIGKLDPLSSASHDDKKINLTDLLELLYMRNRHLLKDPSVEQIIDKSVTDEQHKLMSHLFQKFKG